MSSVCHVSSSVSRAAVLLACGVALACGEASTGPFSYPEDAPPNILLISIDSLRADHLSSYGYARDTSPWMDALASDGVLFENALAAAPWTLPSHASLLTGLHARTHQVTRSKRKLPPGAFTLARALRMRGYATYGVVSGPFMQRRFGLDVGFEVYDDTLARMTHEQSHEATTSPEIEARASTILEQTERPFFLFLHYWDVHYDYIPPGAFATRFDPDYTGSISARGFRKNDAINPEMAPRDLEHLIALYDGEIAWVDEHIGRLFAALRGLGLWENTIVILTADHGDEFFEHGGKGHESTLYQELLHVPLIVRFPGMRAGVRVRERVSLIDVMPTLLDALGSEIPPTLQGRSLWPRLRGEALEPARQFASTTRAKRGMGRQPKTEAWTLLDGASKVIRFKTLHGPEFYDLERDPREQQNQVTSPEGKTLLAELDTWLETTPEGVDALEAELDAETRERLEALGYIDGDDVE